MTLEECNQLNPGYRKFLEQKTWFFSTDGKDLKKERKNVEIKIKIKQTFSVKRTRWK